MRLNFHGSLREQFGAFVDMAAETVAEAIEGFSRQVDWPRKMRVAVVGIDTPEKFLQKPDEVDIMPTFQGGGGKFGSIILGAVLVVAGIALLATPFGVPLIVSGGLMVLQGVINLFMKAPSSKGSNDPDASKYLGINKNTTEVGTPIQMAWGRIDIAPHWLSLQSDSTNLSYGVFPATPT